MEVGGKASWPFPAEWGLPRFIPDRAQVDSEAAGRFLAEWARYQIRKRQRAAKPMTGAAAVAQLRLKALRARLLDD